MEMAMTGTDFRLRWQERLTRSRAGMTPVERKYYFYSKYNWDRQRHVESHYEASRAFLDAVRELPENVQFHFITDDWCIDSAYSLPQVEAAVRHRPDIRLELYIRDEHLTMMDRYLTNGSRSIPVLIVRDSEGRDLARWGPKPEILRHLRKQLQEGGGPGSEVVKLTSDWYEDNGWLEVERELTECMLNACRTFREHQLNDYATSE